MKVVKRNVLETLLDDICLVNRMDSVVSDAFDEVYRAHANSELRWKPRDKNWQEFETVVTIKSGRGNSVKIRVVLCCREISPGDTIWFLNLGDFSDRLFKNSYEWQVRDMVSKVAGVDWLPEES